VDRSVSFARLRRSDKETKNVSGTDKYNVQTDKKVKRKCFVLHLHATP
jgi:hypothetical protein